MGKICRLALVVSVSAGCSSVSEYDEGGLPGTDAGPGSTGEFGDNGPCEKMDIVFVIDNSGSMREEQDNLIANFPSFAEVIDQFRTEDGSPIDYRLAVTTAGRDVSYSLKAPEPFGLIPFTESGDNGAFRKGCGMTKPWIDAADGDVVEAFTCIADVGTGGPGAEMPLLGLEWSLSQRTAATNSGFVRDDALLGIVMITDQDDCSRTDDGFTIDGQQPSCFDPTDPNILPLEHYLGFLDNLKFSRGRWASAVISGQGPGSCSSSFGNAAEAVRMNDFVTQAGSTSVSSSICDGDLSGALQEALSTFESACNAFPPVE